jgi:hypothetical protein
LETGSVVFKLAPGAVLSGVVTADGGDPVESATVMLFEKPRGHEPNARIQQAETATTDDTGAYEFPGLKAGEYLLAVKAQPWYAISHPSIMARQTEETEAQAALDVAYPVTFFDSTTEEGSAAPIVLTGGSRQQANISLHAVPALHLRMQTPLKQDGSFVQPQLQQTIFGTAVPDGSVTSVNRVGEGSTEFSGVAPGHYELTQGDPPRVVEMDATASQQVGPDAGVPTVPVAGTLRNTAGTSMTGPMMVSLEPVDGAGAVTQSVNVQSANTVQPVYAQSANGDSFTVPAVSPGVWALRVQGQSGPMPVMSIVAGGQRLAGNRITVQDRPVSLAVMVSADAARVEGFARKPGTPPDGSSSEGRKGDTGFAGAMVVLVPKDLTAMADLARRDQSDSDGSFALLDVAPGEYTVVAIEDGWDLDWSNPAVIARYLPGGVAVTVKDRTNNGSGNEPDRRVALSGPVAVQER